MSPYLLMLYHLLKIQQVFAAYSTLKGLFCDHWYYQFHTNLNTKQHQRLYSSKIQFIINQSIKCGIDDYFLEPSLQSIHLKSNKTKVEIILILRTCMNCCRNSEKNGNLINSQLFRLQISYNLDVEN